MDEILKALMEFLKEASPVAWNALVRQVYATAVLHVFWAGVATGGGVILWKIAPRFGEYMDDKGARHFTTGVAVVLFFISLIFVSMAGMKFYNPDYYAIRIILDALGR